jgi:hypothetical protein
MSQDDSQQASDAANSAPEGLPEALQAAAKQSESAPLREDQVQNAVAFLTNEKVVVRSWVCWPEPGHIFKLELAGA